MDILFASAQLEKLCTEDQAARKKLGPTGARKLRARLADLDAASRLAEITRGHPHPLKGDRAGEFALDLEGACRLVFEAAGKVPRTAAGDVDWAAVTAIRVVFIGDYHG